MGRFDDLAVDITTNGDKPAADETTDLGVALLDELDNYLARYVAFPSIEARHAVALWVVHCHAVDAFESTPRLALISPEKGSGKTRRGGGARHPRWVNPRTSARRCGRPHPRSHRQVGATSQAP
jgi:hypothetical protein